MRKLILIPSDLLVRNFVRTGAFAAVEDSDTAYLASNAVEHLDEVQGLPGFSGTVHDDAKRTAAYYRVRMIITAAMRERSRTMDARIARLRLRERIYTKALAHPRIRDQAVQRALGRAGLNADLEAALDRLQPDLVIAPTTGTDTLVFDLLTTAGRRGIETLMLVNGWDNMSSKFTFPHLPDYLGVWGEHSLRHAHEIHGIPRERIFVTGVPTFAGHFGFDPQRQPSPYPFPYVLFAGAALAFDELTALRRLDREVASLGIPGLGVVYRPHPARHYRQCDDVFREQEFENTLLDEQVREPYLAAADQGLRVFRMPDLDWYPALLGHARAVLCPLSTMVVEAAIVETPVIAMAYDDGIHKIGLSRIVGFDHYEGLASMTGVSVCRSEGDLVPQLRHWLGSGAPAGMRESIRPWLHFDERPYAQRLAEVVGAIERVQAGSRPSTAPSLA